MEDFYVCQIKIPPQGLPLHGNRILFNLRYFVAKSMYTIFGVNFYLENGVKNDKHQICVLTYVEKF